MKATYGEVTHNECPLGKCKMGADFEDTCDKDGCASEGVESREIFKDPITDDGTKKSAKGLLAVFQHSADHKQTPNQIWLGQQVTEQEEATGLLETVFEDGKLVKHVTLDEIRSRLVKIL